MSCNGVVAIMPCVTWDVQQVISTHKRATGEPQYAVVILNRPISQSQNFVFNFWNNALVRVTVDAGTKQWDSYLNTLPENLKNNAKLPDLITGDFDSVPKDILEKYEKEGCKVVYTPDQMFTDFTKSLMELNKYCQEHKLDVEYIVAIAQSSGRIDHVLANIATLYEVRDKKMLQPKMTLFLMTDDALSWLLNPSLKHIITIPENTRKHKNAWCSLAPVGEHCPSVTTTGLKYNLENGSLGFGDLVGTSNAFDSSKHVTVICSRTLFWSMRIPSMTSEK